MEQGENSHAIQDLVQMSLITGVLLANSDDKGREDSNSAPGEIG